MLTLAVYDALLVLGFYNLLFRHRFGQWAGLTGSIGGLIVVWLSASYLLGRYSRPDPGLRDSQRRRLAVTLLVGALVLAGVVLVFNWGLRLDDPRTFRSFVAPILGASTIASSAAQVLSLIHI
jgi:hypothetical protein